MQHTEICPSGAFFAFSASVLFLAARSRRFVGWSGRRSAGRIALAGVFGKIPMSHSARTPFTTGLRGGRILRITTNFQGAIDDTIMDVRPPLVRPGRRRASGGIEEW